MTVTLALLETSLIGAVVWAAGFVWRDPFPAGWFVDAADLGRALALSLCCLVAFYYQELYDLRVARTYREFLSRLPRSAGLVLILAAGTWALIPGTRLPQGAMVPVLLVILALLLSLRAVVYRVLALRPFVRRALILGDGRVAARVAEEIEARPHARYALLGLVADATGPTGVTRRRLLGTLDDLERIIGRTGPDRIIVALDERRGRLPVSLLLEARARGILVEDGIEVLERLTGKIAIEALHPSALVFCRDFHPTRFHEMAGRAVSLLTAVVGLLTLAPLLAMIALLIKLDSHGPVLFIQERAGLRGRRFRLLKFRTMLPAAGPRSEWVRDNGDRITRVGGWLRRFRLDELPQFVNILRGDMNLVGPRPHPMSNVPLFDDGVPYYSLRSTLRPGVTGWAQVRFGYANNLEEETEKMRYDLYYIKHRSLGLDLRILLDTVKIVLLGRCAGEGVSSPDGPPERGRATTIRWEIDPRHAPGRALALHRRRRPLPVADDFALTRGRSLREVVGPRPPLARTRRGRET
jgi:exopolysaccharide biosynthesis polyprenyl glycosylphosphotransferase